MSAQASSTSSTVDEEILQEQLIHCFNIQNAVIQNLNQYSQQISLQLFDIRKHVDILTYRVIDLQQQQQLRRIYVPPPPPPPPPQFLLPFPFPSNLIYQEEAKPVIPLAPSSTSKSNEPFIFTPICTNNLTVYTDEKDDDDDDHDEPKITFERIVELAPVDVKTGEEDEEILFCERAKLYRYDLSTRQYKERGTGPMKILQHRTTGFCRILMRREQIWKICANHQITIDTTLKPHQNNDTSFVWSAIDFADGLAKEELFCIRFKTNDLAEQFFRKFNEAKEINRRRKMQMNDENALPSIERISFNNDDDEDPIIIAEARPTPDQIIRARRLQLPLTFYLYENKDPCPGCRGCQIDSNPRLPLPKGFPLTSVQMYRPIIRAKRTLPINRVPPAPVLSIPIQSTNLVEQNQGSKKSRHVPSHDEHSTSFSLDDFANDLAKTIVHLAKEELYKRWNDETLDRLSFSSSDSHPGFSFSSFNTRIDTSKPLVFNFQGTSPVTFSYPTPIDDNDDNEEILICENVEFDQRKGLMKIIRNKTDESYRLTMNEIDQSDFNFDHRIDSTTNLRDDSSNENSFILSSTNFTDRTVTFERRDIAQRFLQQFQQAKCSQGSPTDDT